MQGEQAGDQGQHSTGLQRDHWEPPNGKAAQRGSSLLGRVSFSIFASFLWETRWPAGAGRLASRGGGARRRSLGPPCRRGRGGLPRANPAPGLWSRPAPLRGLSQKSVGGEHCCPPRAGRAGPEARKGTDAPERGSLRLRAPRTARRSCAAPADSPVTADSVQCLTSFNY